MVHILIRYRPLSVGKITMSLFFLRFASALFSSEERFCFGDFASSRCFLITSLNACASPSSLILLAVSSVLAIISKLGTSVGVEARFSQGPSVVVE